MIRIPIIALLSAALLLCACHNGAIATGPEGLIGNRLDPTYEEGDRDEALEAAQRAYTADIGQQVIWNNPNNGDTGTIIPVRDSYADNGAYCREFQETIIVNDSQQKKFKKACQQRDGSWKIVR